MLGPILEELCRTVENQGIAIFSEATLSWGIRSNPLGDANKHEPFKQSLIFKIPICPSMFRHTQACTHTLNRLHEALYPSGGVHGYVLWKAIQGGGFAPKRNPAGADLLCSPEKRPDMILLPHHKWLGFRGTLIGTVKKSKDMSSFT